jgi:hypothetical protein
MRYSVTKPISSHIETPSNHFHQVIINLPQLGQLFMLFDKAVPQALHLASSWKRFLIGLVGLPSFGVGAMGEFIYVK